MGSNLDTSPIQESSCCEVRHFDDAHGKEEEVFSYSTKCELALLKRPVKTHDITHKLGCSFCVSLVD